MFSTSTTGHNLDVAATGMVAKHLVRRGLRGLIAVGIVAGLGGGFAATAIAGARRADTAYRRLERNTFAPTAFFDGSGLDDAALARINSVPGVAATARFAYTPVAPAASGANAGAFVALDPAFLTTVYRPLIVRGRAPRPGAADEVLVNEVMARRAGLRAGQHVTLRSGFDRSTDLGRVTIAGIARGTFDVGVNAGNSSMLLPYAFGREHHDQLTLGPQPAGLLRLDSGTTLGQVRGPLATAAGRDLFLSSTQRDAESVQRALAVQSIGLTVLGIAALFATLAAVVQALSRQFDRLLVDLPTLVAIGYRPRRRVGLGALIALPVAVVGTAVGAVGSIVASPLIPTGYARTVDPRRGVQVDAFVLGGLVLGILAVVTSAGAFLAWRHRTSRSRAVNGHDVRFARALPLRLRLGLRAALAPTRAPAGAAARSALVGTAVAVTAVVAVTTFGASLTSLLDEPREYGWTFDATIIGSDGGATALRPQLTALSTDPHVARVGYLTVTDVMVAGTPTEAFAFADDGLALHPALRAGRAPAASDEATLGRDLADALDVGIGDAIVVRGRTSKARVRVVGIATYPELGNNSDLAQTLSLTDRMMRRIGGAEHAGVALIRLEPGARVSDLRRYQEAGEIVAPFRPPRVRNLQRVGGLPTLLAGFLATLGLLALAHGLWRTIGVNRRDDAVLAALGMRPRERRSIVVWQAAVVAVIAVVIGIPLGVVLGRRAWSAVADATGVLDHLVIPWTMLGLIGGVAVLGALVTGLVATRAAGQSPSSALRDL